MKLNALTKIVARMTLAFGLPLASMGCVAEAAPGAPETQDTDAVEDADEASVASAAEALSTCGLKPYGAPPPCNSYVCTEDGWEPRPLATGTTCRTDGGDAGLCDGDAAGHGGGNCIANITGVLFPTYHVLSVMYAPPGSASNVDYGQGSTFGSTTSNASSWSSNLSVAVSNKNDIPLFASGDLTVTGTWNASGSATDSYDIKSTASSNFIVGGFHDEINHDLDRIYLWLNPQVNITSNSVNQSVSWGMTTPAGQHPVIQYVNVLWLRDPSTMPTNVESVLRNARITPVDYPKILAVDPLATSSNLDQNRFKYQTSIPYEPVAILGQSPTMTRYTINKTTTSTTAGSSATSYSVGVTAQGSVSFLDFIAVKLKVTGTLTWTNTNQFSKSTAATLSATASIMQPAYGYTGSTILDVYLDTVFNTYVFVLV